MNDRTGICISPDEKFVLTGTSVKKGYGYGMLVAYDAQLGLQSSRIAVSQDSVISVMWNEEINQIIVGSSDGNMRIFYDPEKSQKGVM